MGHHDRYVGHNGGMLDTIGVDMSLSKGCEVLWGLYG